MATHNFTNRKASQALNGQAVIVTLDSTDAASLTLLSKGQLATNNSSGKTGTVYSVDTFGSSFKISPIQPDKNFESSGTYGYLAVSETVIVTL